MFLLVCFLTGAVQRPLRLRSLSSLASAASRALISSSCFCLASCSFSFSWRVLPHIITSSPSVCISGSWSLVVQASGRVMGSCECSVGQWSSGVVLGLVFDGLFNGFLGGSRIFFFVLWPFFLVFLNTEDSTAVVLASFSLGWEDLCVESLFLSVLELSLSMMGTRWRSRGETSPFRPLFFLGMVVDSKKKVDRYAIELVG